MNRLIIRGIISGVFFIGLSSPAMALTEKQCKDAGGTYTNEDFNAGRGACIFPITTIAVVPKNVPAITESECKRLGGHVTGHGMAKMYCIFNTSGRMSPKFRPRFEREKMTPVPGPKLPN